jgi:hypothetical protein
MPKPKPSREPAKLTPDRTAAICDLLRQGVPQRIAARSCGVSVSTMFRWKQLGREALEAGGEIEPLDRPFVEFYDAVEQATTDAKRAYSLLVQKAAIDRDVTQAQEWLERSTAHRHPEPEEG